MREIDAIISAYETAKQNRTATTLATVVHVEGSSYRRSGARMLVDQTGQMTGAISGGCLEGDALRKALHAIHQQKNKLITYDTSDEEDSVIGAQLGCEGVIQVLFEPIDYSDDANPVELIKVAHVSPQTVIICTLFHLNKSKEQIGTSLVVDQDLRISGKLPEEVILDQLKEDSREVLSNEVSLFREYQDEDIHQYVFLECYTQPLQLVIVGAGNDAQVLAQMADLLGWDVVVTDGRPSHANTNRFIGACQVIVSKPEHVLENIEVSKRTVFVLMTHNYNYDLSVFKLLLDQDEIPYIGILGPKKKYTRMLDQLAGEGFTTTDQQLKKVYAPIGLELGAESPSEIALSILSEIQAVITETPGASLKHKDGPIHQKKNNAFKSIKLERA